MPTCSWLYRIYEDLKTKEARERHFKVAIRVWLANLNSSLVWVTTLNQEHYANGQSNTWPKQS